MPLPSKNGQALLTHFGEYSQWLVSDPFWRIFSLLWIDITIQKKKLMALSYVTQLFSLCSHTLCACPPSYINA